MRPSTARAEDARFRSLLDAMDDAYCTVDVLFDVSGRAVDHRILDANPAFERHTGVSNPIGKLASARHNAEQALLQRTLQFETLLNEAPLGVYLVDADFRVRAVNPAALPRFEGIADLIGRDFDDVIHLLWTGDRADEFVQRFHQTLETGESFLAADEAVLRKGWGDAEYYAWQINRISLPEGGFGVVCYYRDISVDVEARTRLADSEAQYRVPLLSPHPSPY